MSTLWPEGCWWPKSVEGGCERDQVRLDGWCEGGLRQQRNDDGGCATMRAKIGKSWEPWYLCNWMSFRRPFLLSTVFFRTALPCSGGYHMGSEGMPLHDDVGINCKKVATTENQGSGVKYMGWLWWLCVCVIWLSLIIYIIVNYLSLNELVRKQKIFQVH